MIHSSTTTTTATIKNMGGGDTHENEQSLIVVSPSNAARARAKAKAKGKGKGKRPAKNPGSSNGGKGDCLSMGQMCYRAAPKGKNQCLYWVPIHCEAMNERMKSVRIKRIKGFEPVWIMCINLTEPEEREYADINVWPDLDNKFMREQSMHFSQYALEKEGTGMVVNHNHWEAWTPEFFETTIDMLRFSEKMAARGDMASSPELMSLLASKTREQEILLEQIRREEDQQERARSAAAWKEFGHAGTSEDGYLPQLMRHKALVTAYLEEGFTANDEYTRLSENKRMLQPHVPTTVAGEARQILTRWCMSSLLQREMPLLRKELSSDMGSAGCSEITAVLFNPRFEL